MQVAGDFMAINADFYNVE